jgi:hypothetical protein
MQAAVFLAIVKYGSAAISSTQPGGKMTFTVLGRNTLILENWYSFLKQLSHQMTHGGRYYLNGP